MNPKSVLEPATQLVFLGKWLDLLERMVWSHEVARVDSLAVAKEAHAIFSRLPSLAGVACPFVAGAYCWINGEQAGHTPVAVLESLVVQTVASELWRTPLPGIQNLCLELG